MTISAWRNHPGFAARAAAALAQALTADNAPIGKTPLPPPTGAVGPAANHPRPFTPGATAAGSFSSPPVALPGDTNRRRVRSRQAEPAAQEA